MRDAVRGSAYCQVAYYMNTLYNMRLAALGGGYFSQPQWLSA